MMSPGFEGFHLVEAFDVTHARRIMNETLKKTHTKKNVVTVFMNVTETHVMNEYEIMNFLYETGDFEKFQKATFKLSSNMSGNKRI